MAESTTGKALAVLGLWLTDTRNRHARALDDLLLAQEEVLFVGSGFIVREGLPAVRRWIVAATSERLLCVKRGQIAPRTIAVPRHAILNVSTARSLLGWQLVVSTGQGEVRIQAGREACMGLQQILATTVALPERISRAGAVENDGVAPHERSRVEYLENAVEGLESDIARLQQQVDFLEDILRSKSGSGPA